MKKLHIPLLIAFFVIPGISFASIGTNLKYGSRGLEVSELQDFLIDKGFLYGQSSGNFFSLTRKAVVAYQTSVGLPATGYVGSMTRTKINDDLFTINAPAISAEITETGTTTAQTNTIAATIVPVQISITASPLAHGCSSTVGFSTTTGSPCLVGITRTTPTTNKLVDFPNGAVVEIDSIGNIVRWVKEPLAILQAPNQNQSVLAIKKSPADELVSVSTLSYIPVEIPDPVVTPPVIVAAHAITYSDYNFKYQWGDWAGLNEVSCPMTPRNLGIKKAVFRISAAELQKISELVGVEPDGFKVTINSRATSIESRRADKSRSGVYSLEEKSPNTFTYFGGEISICSDGSSVTIGDISGTLADTTAQGRNVKAYLAQKGITVDVWDNIYTPAADVSFKVHISPVMSEWEVWDYTTNTPVKINL